MDKELELASKYWDEARELVMDIAKENGYPIEIKEHDDEFLFDLFSDEDHYPTDEEIADAIEDYFFDQIPIDKLVR